MQDKKGELKKIESLLEEIKTIQKKTIENNSENPFNEQLIKKNLIINKLTKELISKQKINEKILLVFGFLKRKILETQKTKEKFDSLKEKKTEIEGKLFKSEKDKRILVIETENLEREVITLKTLLNGFFIERLW